MSFRFLTDSLGITEEKEETRYIRVPPASSQVDNLLVWSNAATGHLNTLYRRIAEQNELIGNLTKRLEELEKK